MSDTERFSYAVSLRIHHPSIDATEITRELQIEPTSSWTAGSRRRTPAGTLLDGFREETYWYARLLPSGGEPCPQPHLEVALAEVVGRINVARGFLDCVIRQGGRVVVSIGLQGDRPYGFEISPALSQQLGALGVAVLFDVFQDSQNR